MAVIHDYRVAHLQGFNKRTQTREEARYFQKAFEATLPLIEPLPYLLSSQSAMISMNDRVDSQNSWAGTLSGSTEEARLCSTRCLRARGVTGEHVCVCVCVRAGRRLLLSGAAKLPQFLP
ncbi:hypothetical protein MHYP_G00215560 [Metynnis hypsauchen]